jgi:hypothetical protein
MRAPPSGAPYEITEPLLDSESSKEDKAWKWYFIVSILYLVLFQVLYFVAYWDDVDQKHDYYISDSLERDPSYERAMTFFVFVELVLIGLYYFCVSTRKKDSVCRAQKAWRVACALGLMSAFFGWCLVITCSSTDPSLRGGHYAGVLVFGLGTFLYFLALLQLEGGFDRELWRGALSFGVCDVGLAATMVCLVLTFVFCVMFVVSWNSQGRTAYYWEHWTFLTYCLSILIYFTLVCSECADSGAGSYQADTRRPDESGATGQRAVVNQFRYAGGREYS